MIKRIIGHTIGTVIALILAPAIVLTFQQSLAVESMVIISAFAANLLGFFEGMITEKRKNND
jgi:predicted membrane channel-forming protein YqfA (hemolysin III family)